MSDYTDQYGNPTSQNPSPTADQVNAFIALNPKPTEDQIARFKTNKLSVEEKKKFKLS